MMVLALMIWSLPNAQLTPGVIRPLTQQQVCAMKWGLDDRHVTYAMKSWVAAVYLIPRKLIVGRTRGPCCEYDHLIPRELGGADDIANLWPQRWDEARLKDRLENWLHRQVCTGKMTLFDAQNAIRLDWWAAYWQMVHA